MQLPLSQDLEIKYLSKLFSDRSQSYKFFWFQAILIKVIEGKTELTFNELINEMVANAWYMVTEYHLNLGPSDSLEKLVLHLQEVSGIKSCEKREKIIEYLENCTDKEVQRMKRTLTYNVPYRLQAPFLTGIRGKEWDVNKLELINRINKHEHLLYYFMYDKGLESVIRMQSEWCAYIRLNQEILKGWLGYEMILYLQKRNPNVPGISDKLMPPQARNLEKVKKYWRLITDITPIEEIYGAEQINKSNISIDHFIPWSYVAHDELWNLHPTTKSINSAKSNNLPKWDIYFKSFAGLEYISYQHIWKYDKVHDLFEICKKEHLNSDTVRERIYRRNLNEAEFVSALEEVVHPVYQAADHCGFGQWSYEKR